jgi:hypothetical protein
MPSERIIHCDTIDGIPNYDQAYANRNIALGGQYAFCTLQTFNTSIPLMVPVENVTSVSLKMVEIPMTASNIRNSNLSDTFTYTFNFGSYVNITRTVTLTNMNHTSIASLLSDLNTAIALSISVGGLYTGFYITFYVNPNDNAKIMVKSNTSNTQGSTKNFSFGTGIFTNIILGVNQNGDYSIRNATDGLEYMTCTNNWNLQPDNYYNMTITNLQTTPSNASGRQATFKIPINGSFGQIVYYSENIGIVQKVSIDRPNTILDKINIVITDRWGFPIFSQGSQISFTLSVMYENPNNGW